MKSVIARFPALRVAVIGDMMADHHLQGRPTRLSREAPVVVLQYEREFYVPGGAANCAANLLSLGAKVSLFGALGEDEPGRILREQFRRQGAAVGGLVASPRYRTITKTRVLAGDPHRTKQQIVRIDREPPPLPADLRSRIHAAAARAKVDAWLVPDYGYGVVTETLIARLRREKGRGAVVVGSSRYAVHRMRGLSAVTANEAEALEASGESQPLQAGRTLFKRLKPKAFVLTRGNEGMLCFDGNGAAPLALCASGSQEAVDVTGAGDTVCAVMTLALAAGAPPREAARLANAAAGEVVMRPGAATLTPEELEAVAERPPA